jgi:hypothetical protein
MLSVFLSATPMLLISSRLIAPQTPQIKTGQMAWMPFALF